MSFGCRKAFACVCSAHEQPKIYLSFMSPQNVWSRMLQISQDSENHWRREPESPWIIHCLMWVLVGGLTRSLSCLLPTALHHLTSSFFSVGSVLPQLPPTPPFQCEQTWDKRLEREKKLKLVCAWYIPSLPLSPYFLQIIAELVNEQKAVCYQAVGPPTTLLTVSFQSQIWRNLPFRPQLLWFQSWEWELKPHDVSPHTPGKQ